MKEDVVQWHEIHTMFHGNLLITSNLWWETNMHGHDTFPYIGK